MDSIQDFNVFMPTKIIFGIGRVSEIGGEVAQYGKRAMLVTYKDIRGLEGTIEKVTSYLEEAGISVEKYSEVEPDPSVEIINAGAEIVRAKDIEVMVGLGGGSAIDSAKAIAAVAVNGGDAWDYPGCNPDFRTFNASLPILAIPTTSGTGTEVTAVAVITNRKIVSKGAIVNPLNIPKVAIVDPGLMKTMPPKLTASTGADAMGHALEAYVSRKSTPFVKRMAPEAIKLIWDNLPTAYRDGGNMLARSNMAWASTIAGIMLVQSGTTGNHSFAQALGAHLHVPHGVGVAMGTPIFLEYCIEESFQDYVNLANELGIDIGPERDGFVKQIKAFLEDLDIPMDLKNLSDKVDREALLENAMFNAKGALANTPREVTRADMAKMLSGIF